MKALWAVAAVIVLAGGIYFFKSSDSSRDQHQDTNPVETETSLNLPEPPSIENVQAAPENPTSVQEDPNWQPPDAPERTAEQNLEEVLRMEAEDAVRSGQIQASEAEAFKTERRNAYNRERANDAREADIEREMNLEEPEN